MARIEGASLNVTAQTTLQELKDFADTAGGVDGAKLRGTDNGDGTYTLYAVDNDSSLFSRISGKSRQRRDDARAAINLVFANNVGDSRLALQDVNARVNHDGGRSPKAAMLQQLMAFTQSGRPEGMPERRTDTYESRIEQHEAQKPPHVAPLGILQSRDQIADLMRPVMDTDSMTTLMDTANQMVGVLRLRTEAMTPEGKLDMALSSQLKDDILEQLKMGIGGAPDPAQMRRMDAVADTVAGKLADQILGTHQVDQNTFTKGDVVYTREGQLGNPGAFGTAYLYSGSDGSQVVLKVQNERDNTLLRDTFESEIKQHSQIEGIRGGNPSILKLEGAIRMGDGSLGILSEVASGGDVSGARAMLFEAVKNETITPEQANILRLTLARDFVDGMKTMHDNGLMHRDFKLLNVFVSESGQGKVADFGTVRENTDYDTTFFQDIDAPHFRPPEQLRAQRDLKLFDTQVGTYNERVASAMTDAFNDLVAPGGLFGDINDIVAPPATLQMILDSEVGETFGSVFADMTRANLEKLYEGKGGQVIDFDVHPLFDRTVGGETGAEVVEGLLSTIDNRPDTMVGAQQYDSWAVGIGMLELFTEGPVFTHKWNSHIQRHLENWMVTGTQAVGPGSNLGFHDGNTVELDSGDEGVNTLLNRLLDPDPETRASIGEALNDTVFNRPGVGSPEARNLLSALIKGEGIEEAKLGLNAAL